MDARAGENDTPTKLKKERINTQLKRRKKAIQKNYSKSDPFPPYKKSKHIQKQ